MKMEKICIYFFLFFFQIYRIIRTKCGFLHFSFGFRFFFFFFNPWQINRGKRNWNRKEERKTRTKKKSSKFIIESTNWRKSGVENSNPGKEETKNFLVFENGLHGKMHRKIWFSGNGKGENWNILFT